MTEKQAALFEEYTDWPNSTPAGQYMIRDGWRWHYHRAVWEKHAGDVTFRMSHAEARQRMMNDDRPPF